MKYADNLGYSFLLFPVTYNEVTAIRVSYQPVHWWLPHPLLSSFVDSLITQTVTWRVFKQLGNWNFTAKIQSV